MSLVTYLHPDDCDPPHGLDLDSEHDRLKVLRLRDAFLESGFDPAMPALVGYVRDGRVQLLSGTHRHLAAKMAGIFLPVTLWLGSDVEECWGELEDWVRVVKDIPVQELETWTRDDLERSKRAT